MVARNKQSICDVHEMIYNLLVFRRSTIPIIAPCCVNKVANAMEWYQFEYKELKEVNWL